MSAQAWKVGDVHPVTGTVCVEVDDQGVPRWDYPQGHPKHGMARRLLADLGRKAAKS